MRWLDRPARRRAEADPAPDQASEIAAQMARAFEAARGGDYAGALAIWGPLAQAGVARAQNNVGACFAEGLGIARDLGLALRWLTLAAEASDPVGQRNLASLYFKGEGIEQDYARAAELYLAAAEQGDGPAQDMLSWMLLEGECIAGDAVEARRWARAAAKQGIAAAMTRVGMIYHNALGVERDP
ncbi:MAG: tetratricopeptide repeat protein, partial [Rhodoplanes sp.]